MYNKTIAFIREIFDEPDKFVPLHEPRFVGNEKVYLNECIDSTYISSIGPFVDKFEQMVAQYTGAKRAVVCVNGTSALYLALHLVGVGIDDEVITQPLTFIATVNAISYCGANPVFIDVDRETMGLSPIKLMEWLEENAYLDNKGICYNKTTRRPIKACIPMHTFGHPVKLQELISICNKWNITLIEDAAESLGSFYHGIHTGTFGKIGILSFNGNKTITTGGGGMLLFQDETLANYAKHLSTQAKVPHRWEFVHDHVGFNYRMPNINAAIGCAQMENIDEFITSKRSLAQLYSDFFKDSEIDFFGEPSNCASNYWLNAILLPNKMARDQFLSDSNDAGVMTRPIWQLMNKLPMFTTTQCGDLSNSLWFEERVVNIPSSVRWNKKL